MTPREAKERAGEVIVRLRIWAAVQPEHGDFRRELLRTAEDVEALAAYAERERQEKERREELLRECLAYFEGYDRERTDGRTSPIIPRLRAALAASPSPEVPA